MLAASWGKKNSYNFRTNTFANCWCSLIATQIWKFQTLFRFCIFPKTEF